MLMKKLGRKQLTLQLQTPFWRSRKSWRAIRWSFLPTAPSLYTLSMPRVDRTGIAGLLRRLAEHGIDFKDLHTSESSLEDIFVSLVRSHA